MIIIGSAKPKFLIEFLTHVYMLIKSRAGGFNISQVRYGLVKRPTHFCSAVGGPTYFFFCALIFSSSKVWRFKKHNSVSSFKHLIFPECPIFVIEQSQWKKTFWIFFETHTWKRNFPRKKFQQGKFELIYVSKFDPHM